MTDRLPLFSQPTSFWLGAFMVAETPVLLAASLIAPAARERVLESLFVSPVALGGALAGVVGLGLLVGWLGHRLGLGL